MQSVLTKGIVDNQTFLVDPTILSILLLVLIERSENTARYVSYELTPYPTSLFQDYFMRKPDKSILMHAILSYNNDNKGKKRKINRSYKFPKQLRTKETQKNRIK